MRLRLLDCCFWSDCGLHQPSAKRTQISSWGRWIETERGMYPCQRILPTSAQRRSGSGNMRPRQAWPNDPHHGRAYKGRVTKTSPPSAARAAVSGRARSYSLDHHEFEFSLRRNKNGKSLETLQFCTDDNFGSAPFPIEKTQSVAMKPPTPAIGDALVATSSRRRVGLSEDTNPAASRSLRRLAPLARCAGEARARAGYSSGYSFFSHTRSGR